MKKIICNAGIQLKPYLLSCLFLFNLISIYASETSLKQTRVYENDKIFDLIESLYLSSAEINPGNDNLLTYNDVELLLNLWQNRHPDPDQNQLHIINDIQAILNAITNNGRIRIKAGLDYMYHNVPDCTETSPFYNKFRDQDFETKYTERGRFFDATLDMPLYKSIFLSTRTSLKNDWKYFNRRHSDFPRNLKEFNADFNEKSILTCRLDNLFIQLGRDRINFGIGEFSKLLINSNLPPVDHFQFSINYKEDLAFTFLIGWMKNAVLEDEHPKIMYVHRLSYRFLDRLYLALTEMQMTNQDLNSKYINPFMIYHNEYDYPSQRNIMTAADAELALGYNAKVYGSFAVDEIDVSALEENGNKGREAWGLIFGFKKKQPFGLYHSNWVVEWTKLTKWIYSYGFPWLDYYTLNYVYEENQDKLEPVEFHRFIGNELGPNAEALMSGFNWKGFDLSVKYIEQGKIPILQRAFSELPDTVKSYNYVFGVQYNETILQNRLELKTTFYHTISKNFHQYPGLKKSYSEFWISLNIMIFNIRW